MHMISIVIPVFNEHESLHELYSEINKVINEYNDWEIIFIDDGSSDGARARSYRSRCRKRVAVPTPAENITVGGE